MPLSRAGDPAAFFLDICSLEVSLWDTLSSAGGVAQRAELAKSPGCCGVPSTRWTRGAIGPEVPLQPSP